MTAAETKHTPETFTSIYHQKLFNLHKSKYKKSVYTIESQLNTTSQDNRSSCSIGYNLSSLQVTQRSFEGLQTV